MPRSARPISRDAEPSVDTGAAFGWLFLIGFLLSARYLQPTEAVSFGETLWQAQLWLAGATLWSWIAVRRGQNRLYVSPLDVLLWLLVVGHASSTALVFVEGGDRRAALNVAIEWGGLGAMLFLVRHALLPTFVQRPVVLFGSLMVALASLGIWQHHVSLKETAAQYDRLISEEVELADRIASGEATLQEHQRLEAVRREMFQSGVPTEPTVRRQWENRVKFSTEPFATFGLANTFAGFLAAALPVLVAAVWTLRTRVRGISIRTVVAVISSGLVLYCLLLTKSRTAWVGFIAAGFAALGIIMLRGRLSRTPVLIFAGILIVVSSLALGLAFTGALDQQVLSEAPKSLRYRLDYWTGTLRVLAERPLFGTGPANFRSYYLEHRPVGASEEIAAPHNLFFDVWTAGGLLSLLALLGLFGYLSMRVVLYTRSESNLKVDDSSLGALKEVGWSGLEWGMLAAFPAVIILYLLSASGMDWRLLLISPIAAGAVWALVRSNMSMVAAVVSGAGLAALSVHLLGADGIEYPAVIQTILLFSLVLDRSWSFELRPNGVRWLPFSLFGSLAVVCLLLGVVPVLNSSALLMRAESAILEGDPSADRLLMNAAEADPFAARPPLLSAELATSRALATGSEVDLKSARTRWDEVLEQQPRSVHARQRLAELLSKGERDDARLNVAAQRLLEAVVLSPTDVELRSRLARVLDTLGQSQSAAVHAAAALRLDDVNRDLQHTDLLLEENERAELIRLAAVGNPSAEP